MSAATEDSEHPTRTRRSQYRYLFTSRHHGGDKKVAMWLPDISQDTEFSIFDNADLRQIADDRGWLYGVLPEGNRELRSLGTWDEQVAEFQRPTSAADPWHGYPQWPLDESGPPNRRRQHNCPNKVVFDLMMMAGLITKIQRKRLLTGRLA